MEVKDFELFAGTDNTGTFLGSFSATDFDNGVSNADVFNFAATSTQYITLNALNGFSPLTSLPSIGEVAFRNAVPEPLTILGAGTAVAFGTAFKRKLGKKKA